MTDYPLRDKTKAVALRVMNLVNSLPPNEAAHIIGRQLLRSGTSVGANYRASMRAKSRADMVNKLKIVEEEADESLFWLELLVEGNVVPEARLKPLMLEFEEILSMTVASIKTMRDNGRS